MTKVDKEAIFDNVTGKSTDAGLVKTADGKFVYTFWSEYETVPERKPGAPTYGEKFVKLGNSRYMRTFWKEFNNEDEVKNLNLSKTVIKTSIGIQDIQYCLNDTKPRYLKLTLLAVQ